MESLMMEVAAKTVQMGFASFFIGKFIRATPLWRFMGLLTSALLTAEVLSLFLGNFFVFFRGVIMLLLQVGFILWFRKIPIVPALVYYLIAMVLMTVAELPLDMALKWAFPGMKTVADLPFEAALAIEIIYFPIFLASYGIANTVSGQLFRLENTGELRYYVPFLLFQSIEINLPMILLITFTDMYWLIAAVSFVLLMVHVTMLLLLVQTFRRVQESARAEESAKQMEEALSFQIHYYERLQDNISGVQKIRQDMNRQIYTALSLVEENQKSFAMSHLEKTLSLLDQAVYEQFTGNAVADAVISAKMTSCERKKTTLEVSGQLPDDLGISGVDICSIFSNLLDNAIQACEQLPPEKRRIQLYIWYQHPQLRITCENASVDMLDQNLGVDIDSEHGWGLTILRSIALKYGGDLNIISDEGKIKVVFWVAAMGERKGVECIITG